MQSFGVDMRVKCPQCNMIFKAEDYEVKPYCQFLVQEKLCQVRANQECLYVGGTYMEGWQKCTFREEALKRKP